MNIKSNEKTILLVEDEQLIAASTKMVLEKTGYSVITVMTGESAVELITEGKRIDLILMDIDLGSGMDGTEAAQKILKISNLPIIFLTSHSESGMVEKVKGITRYGYVIKTSGDFVLLSSIEMALELFETQKRVNENQERYYQLFENIQSAFALHEIVFDENNQPVDFVFLLVNSAFEKFTGLNRDNILGQHFTSILGGDDNSELMNKCFKIALTGEAETFENYAAGLDKYYSISAYCPKKGTFAVIFSDITDFKNYQNDLEEREFQYHSLADSGLALIWKSGTDALCNYFNEPWYRFRGKTPEEELGTGWLDGVHPDDRQQCNKIYMDAFSQKEKFDMQYRLMNADGTYHWIRDLGSPNYKSNGEFLGYIGHCFDITESKHFENALKESEETSKTLLNSFPESVFLMYPDGEILRINETAASRLNSCPDSLTGKNIYDFIPEEAAEKRKRIVETVVRNKKPQKYEDEIDGIIFDNLISPIMDVPGIVSRLAVIGIDITERKKSENSLIEIQDMLNSVQHIARIGGWQWHFETDKFYWSNEVYRIHDLDPDDSLLNPEELINRSLLCYDLPGRNLLVEAFKHCKTDGEPYDLELPFTSTAGRHMWVRTAAIPVFNGGKVEKIVGHIMDITDYKTQKNELVLSEEKFRTIFDLSKVGAVIVGLDKRFQKCNDAFCRFIGCTEKELIGKTISDVTHPDDIDIGMDALKEMIQGKIESAQFQKRYIRKDGSTVWGDINICMMKDKNHKPYVFLPVIVDITKQKKSDEEIRRQLREKEIILREVNHRIKNNIASVESLINLQMHSTENEEAIAILQDAIGRIKSVRILYDKLVSVDEYHVTSVRSYFETLIDSIINIFPDSGNVSVEKDISDFTFDLKRLFPLGTIVNELITNTMKYAFKGRESGKIRISLHRNDVQVRLEITDNGIGFPDGFDYTNSGGFGLTLVNILVEQLNGTFSMQTDNGIKTVIEFNI
ncbi:MAG: PAS domain S-box protein [Spirochaetes bacterium]|nr:PAS domain S-box protein [Spirochaetota bacterium]